MMNIGQEKEHLYSMMRDITAERRELTKLYFGLKERLDDLHKLEKKGLSDLDLKGYVDLHNKLNQETIINNIKRESRNVINRVNQDFEDNAKTESEKKEEKVTKLIEKEKNQYGDRKPIAQVSYEGVKSIISSILMDNKKPMNLDEMLKGINERLEGAKITKNNLSSNFLYRIMKDDDTNIERVSHGHYQYVE